MANGGTVNSQVTDAVTLSATASIGQAPALTLAMTYDAMADAIGLAMHNAVTTQHNAQVLGGAAVAMTCNLIIALGGASSA